MTVTMFDGAAYRFRIVGRPAQHPGLVISSVELFYRTLEAATSRSFLQVSPYDHVPLSQVKHISAEHKEFFVLAEGKEG